MSRSLHLEVWGIPKAQLRGRAFVYRRGERSHASVYDPEVSRDWKALVIRQVTALRPGEPAQGPIRLQCKFMMPMPKSMRKRDQRRVDAGETMYHTNTPDLEQLIKPIQDVLEQANYFKNDSQVVSYDGSTKVYGRRPGVIITVEELTESLHG